MIKIVVFIISFRIDSTGWLNVTNKNTKHYYLYLFRFFPIEYIVVYTPIRWDSISIVYKIN